MKRETLSDLGLSKEQMDVVFTEHGKSITELKTRLEAAEEERDTLKSNYDSQQEKFETQFAEQQKDFAIGYTMKNADVHDMELITGLLDKSKINITGGELRGLGEQLESLKETRPYLFKEAEVNNSPLASTPRIVVGGNPAGSLATVESEPFSSITDKYKQ